MVGPRDSCSTTDRVLAHVKKEVESNAKELVRVSLRQDGFEDLEPKDQESVEAAFQLDRLREEDITPCLREKEDIEREKKVEKGAEKGATDQKETGKKAPAKSAPKKEEDGDEDIAPPPEDLPAKRTRKQPVRYAPSPKKRRRTKKEDDEDDEEDEEDEEEDEEELEESEDNDSSDAFEEDQEDEEDDEDEEEYDEE